MSDDRLSVQLFNAHQAHEEITQAWRWAKSLLKQGQSLTLEIHKGVRNVEQNRLLHSRISDIAKQIKWAGEFRSIDVWKRLLTAAWLRARVESEGLPAIDGYGIDVVFRHTSELSVSECAELSEYIMAWGSTYETPVKWSKTSLGRDVLEEQPA